MYKGRIGRVLKSSLKINNSYVGETIEKKIQRITSNKEPISDSAPLVYTERKDGVLPAHDIRTDRWDVAIDAMDTVSKANQAKREERQKAKIVDMKKDQEGTKPGGEAGAGAGTPGTETGG